ncbi:MAG: hypothetical protein ACLQFR_10530 [Streptosporangiaceae bacterium]
MKCSKPALGTVLLAAVSVGLLGFAAPAVAAPALGASPASAAGTFVKAFSAIVSKSQVNLSPVDVQATSDGGSIALSETETAKGLGVDWLVKLSSAGTPQWQEEVGCSSPNGAPGDYADGVSVQQTSDGGYIVGGGTIDCGSGSTCPPLSGQSCALVEKLSSAGKLTWARAYAAGPDGSEINQIRQTADGGYVAAGSVTESSGEPAAVILRLDSSGNVQWQQDLEPAAGTSGAVFNSVQQTSAGGYVAAGTYYLPNSDGIPEGQVLVAEFGAGGSLSWQHGFATVSNGTPTSDSNATSIIQTADGGYAVAGGWSNRTFNGGNGARGALLLKLDSSGNLQWQQAYSGGLYYGTVIGSYAYSLHQTSDGGYVLAGDEDIEQPEVTIEPWIAKVSSSGSLLWQHLYYQVYKPTGLPLSEDFSGAAMTSAGGFVAVGPTEDYSTGNDELYVARPTAPGTPEPAPTSMPARRCRPSARN